MENRKNEKGEVMLEGMIVMIVTLFMLIWILYIGFLYYQKYVVRIATNDAAKKIAATYNVPASDPIMGYISSDQLTGRSVYGGMFGATALAAVNQARAESYVKYVLNKANFDGRIKDVKVTLKHTTDAMGRSHVELTTTCAFYTPFKTIHVPDHSTNVQAGYDIYTTTAYADSTYVSDYFSTIIVADAFTDGTFLSGTGFVEKMYKMINSFTKFFDKISS